MTLIFVYNASHTKGSFLVAAAHKIFSPTTYQCTLCSLTHGVLFENRSWRAFKKSTDLDLVFLHKDQFLKQYKSKWLPKYEFPVILSQEKDALELFLSSTDLAKMKDVDHLIDAINARIA